MDIEEVTVMKHKRMFARERPLLPVGGKTRLLRGHKGFTFIEIIVVLAIILILGGTVGIIAFQYVGQANIAAARTQVETYALALNSYAFDNGRFPSPEQGLAALWMKPSGDPSPKNWRGPYLQKEPGPDPWGNPYQYRVPGPNNLPFGVLSYGADGTEGGEGDNADISSWE